MSLTAGYRDATYDMDKDFDRTTSWSDGLHEEWRFSPNLPRAIRRTSSTDDIVRYKRYFSLAQSNQGKLFTWRHYLNILKDELRQFDTLIIMSKVLVGRLATPANSEISYYVTASDSESLQTVKKRTRFRSKLRKISFKRKDIGGDGGSTSSMDDMNSSLNSSISLTPQKNLLKKMCTEIRTLARKTCRTVEKMSSKSKYCTACGDYIGSVKVHKQCSRPFLDGIDCSKPLTPDMVKANNIMKTKTKVYDSTMKTPTGGGELPVDKSGKITFAPSAACRMKPFITRSPQELQT